MIEIWKDIKDYEGLYQVSNYGRVKSLERITIFKDNGRLIKERILKPGVGNKYYIVILCKDKHRKTISIHRLVWDYFGSSKRYGRKLQVDHIDENKLNNHIDNLQLLSQRENVSKGYVFNNKTTSKYTGVYKHKNGWIGQIRICNKRIRKFFNTEEEASIFYKNQLEKI